MSPTGKLETGLAAIISVIFCIIAIPFFYFGGPGWGAIVSVVLAIALVVIIYFGKRYIDVMSDSIDRMSSDSGD